MSADTRAAARAKLARAAAQVHAALHALRAASEELHDLKDGADGVEMDCARRDMYGLRQRVLECELRLGETRLVESVDVSVGAAHG
ncbi:hypothetical protein OWM54_41930 [Myxococcus sp. MISCRS1]|uniref:hypothetical protein n=1 Tax=Myxococcus sp. MISCRS1 TaxID=2996786 RepID=UPI0022719D4A|nr:hypothetical protein [Myxococcus sp. MISCRS1]MCY1003724.1 hypothetical protein [Myxococcus sp. MISCRS1]